MPPPTASLFPLPRASPLLFLALALALLAGVEALIRVPVAQRSFIAPYKPALMYTHAYFDMSPREGGNLIQVDSNNTYFFSRLSSRSEATFQFVKTNNTDLTTSIVNDTIILEGHLVYGMCQYNGSLDYVVALDQNSNEVRVIRLYQDSKQNISYMLDYKKVDRDETTVQLTGNIFVDCSYQETYKGLNSYVIGIAGTYFDPNGISSYYLAKFTTKYNMTEYYILSGQDEVMDQTRGVKVDLENEMLYIAVEVNKNIYHNRTVYAPGALPGEDNANVAIIAYSWNHGVRMWTTLVGNTQYQDKFAKMDVWGNNLYVYINSLSTQYSTNSSQTDIYYYRMRTSNGYIEAQKIFGSATDDFVYDIQATFNGIYILATIGDTLLPHKYNDKTWATQQSQANLVLIWMDLFDDILDIEGYAYSNIPSPYPTRLFVPRIGNHTVDFVLVAARSNDISDSHGGAYITKFDNSTKLFMQTNLCTNPNCKMCSPQSYSQCLKCATNYYLWKHDCYANTCPDYSYPIQSLGLNSLYYCKDCHYSCKTCTGPKPDQCATCCTNNICGSIKNRVPNLGTCTCPNGLTDSNGVCVARCILNLAGKRNNMCYTQCPDNSYPELKYDKSTSQERSQYDSSSQTDCSLSSYHLKFSKSGKGLAVLGPKDFTALPSEFTISFWVRPTSLSTSSYFVNAFGRISVTSQAANQYVRFIYQTSSTTTIEPVYAASAMRSVIVNAWNYISVSLQEYQNVNVLKYKMQMAISNSNMGVVNNAAYDDTQLKQYYPFFVNSIYIGAQSDISPQSFTGYLKEFKFFKKFHGFAQMQDEQLRMYRTYSYDDKNLVAYWKLSEPYTSTDIQYTINDYSMNMNSISYSTLANPDYPQFVFDNTFSLNLCAFHDVALCRSLDYSTSHSQVTSAKKLTQPPTFVLNDWSLIKQDGDQVFFVPSNTPCTKAAALAQMTYRQGLINDFVIEDATLNPVQNLQESTHYQVCYYIVAQGVSFNLYQVYILAMPRTVDPSNRDAYITMGATRKWMILGGDQGYQETIKLSGDCEFPESTDYHLYRNANPDYGTHNINDFEKQGYFFFCWQPRYVTESAFPYFESIHGLKYKIVSEPTVATNSIFAVNVNEGLVNFNFSGVFTDGDQLAVAWKGSPQADCKPNNFLGSVYTHNYSYWPGIWFGQNSGIYGVQNRDMDEVHLCIQSKAGDAPNSWIRLKKTSGTPYFLRIYNYNTSPYNKCPELVSFQPLFGSTELYETDTVIKFNFMNQAVYPSRQQDTPSIIYGVIQIFRGAITVDGRIIKTSQVLWQHVGLDDFHTPDPFQQGDLICTQTGQCSILLSKISNRMKAGEIYFLSFYKFSFAVRISGTRYYLFNNQAMNPTAATAYDHLFFCRSFNVFSSTQNINGRNFQITGVDLLTKAIRAQEQSGSIITSTFTTKAINLVLTVVNTASPYCVLNPPTATVAMKDVTQTSFSVSNLELRECNEGALYADIELVRGIRDQYGDFTYVRSEKLKNIQLGIITCDSSCLQCNGTTASNCVICNPNATATFLYMGTCYTKCPSNAPYYIGYENIFQATKYQQNTCLQECPYGTYPDSITKQCLLCNPDCQTCNSSLIGSCLSCNPVKYLVYSICVTDCPSPHHENNYTSYICNEISKPNQLSVKIQTLGYKSRIPKNTQTYLKASIINEGGSSIVSVQWQQIEPLPTSNEVIIFSKTSDGDLDVKKAVSRLQMTAFNYMSSTQVVKVMVTVTNSVGDIAYDLTEFYLNSPPTLGNSTLTSLDPVNNGTTLTTIYMLNLTNWFDDKDTNFYYKLYMKVDSVYYTLTDQFLNSVVYFQLPMVSTSDKIKTISICVQAIDLDEGRADSCQVLTNVTNNLTYMSNYTSLLTKLMALNYTGNLTNAVFAAHNMYFALNTAPRDSSAPGICTIDYHCNYNGICSSQLGSQLCMCEQGYQGTYCQFQGSEWQNFKTLTNMIVDNLHDTMMNKNEILANDIELVATILRGVLKDPDALDDSNFPSVIDLLERVGGATVYAHFPVPEEVRMIYLDALSAAMLKLYHSFKVQRARSATDGLKDGLTLSDQYAIINQPVTRRILNSEQVGNLHAGKASLIGGSKSQMRELSLTVSQAETFQSWGRRVSFQINNYINKVLMQLTPIYSVFSYKTKAYQLRIQAGYANTFKGIQTYIQQIDSHWNIPSSVFDNQQGRASDWHYISMKTMKWLANPFLFEQNPGAFVESNVTTLTFYDSDINEIEIALSSGDSIEIREPWNKTQGYNSEILGCMHWDYSQNSFINDGSCSFSQIWDIIPCVTCDEGKEINTTVSLCRCSHLSTFATAYQQTIPSQGAGVQIGLYSDFFAMQYWMYSFGLYAVVAGCGTYILGLLIAIVLDRKTMPALMFRLREKVRHLELRGFTQKEEENEKEKRLKEAQPLFVKSNVLGPEETMKDPNFPDVHPPDESKKAPNTEVPLKPVKKKLLPKKSKANKADEEALQESTPVTPVQLPVKSKKFAKKSKKPKVDQSLNASQRNFLGDKDRNHDQSRLSTGGNNEVEEFKHGDNFFDDYVLNTEERKQKEWQNRYDEEQKQKEQAVIAEAKDEEDDDMSQTEKQKKYLRAEKHKAEVHFYKLKWMFIHGSYVPSILFVTSLLKPRHVRWTLCFSCVVLLWFWCAVIFNNTQDPLALPDFNRKSRSIATEYLWVSFIAPWGAMILMYIFAGLFNISNQRLESSYTSPYLEKMLIELRKEMRLRFILAYFITISIFSTVFWYIIKFSATFGWKTSWIWWYAGCFAIAIQFLLLDPIIIITHWVVYKCSRQLALFWMKVRQLKQAKSEA